MSEELAYSIHLGSDKNKTAKAKEVAKNNPSGKTSFSNNGIQNATQLSKVNKHNLRDYDNDKENIQIIYGTDNLYEDMQNLYFQEFEQARIEYNNKQTREDRKIKDYFKHISQDKQKDLACEFIIELGDMDFWNYKDDYYKRGMSQVYKEQVRDLIRIVPEFKVANAVIHFDETSPHMHIVGVPIKEDYKRGMRKQPAKSKVFTKESLQKIQDEMRTCCIKSYNKVYCENSLLKQKKKGRNRDIDIKDMGDYREIKRQLEKKEERLKEANKQTKKIDNTSKDIDKILDSLRDTFRPEFLNRIDEIVIFEQLHQEQLLQIVDLMLEDTKKALADKDITLVVSEPAKKFLLEKGTDIKYGARPLRRAIQRYLEDELSEKILRKELLNSQTVTIDLEENQLTFSVKTVN